MMGNNIFLNQPHYRNNCTPKDETYSVFANPIISVIRFPFSLNPTVGVKVSFKEVKRVAGFSRGPPWFQLIFQQPEIPFRLAILRCMVSSLSSRSGMRLNAITRYKTGLSRIFHG